jgi:hypothetical protein
MGSGCALSVPMGSTPLVIGSTLLVMSEADVVPNFDLGLPVVSIAEVTAMTMNVFATLVTIPMISERAEANVMTLFDPKSPVDIVVELLVASAVSVEAFGKAVRKSSPAKGLLRRGFLGLSPTPSSFGSGCQGSLSLSSSAIGYLSLLDGWFWCFFLWGG